MKKRFLLSKARLQLLIVAGMALGVVALGVTACCDDDGDATVCMRFVTDGNECEACQTGTVTTTDFTVSVGSTSNESNAFAPSPWSLCMSMRRSGGQPIIATLVRICRDAGGLSHVQVCTSDPGIMTPQLCEQNGNAAFVDVHMNCKCYN
jgi:hypothetical protein